MKLFYANKPQEKTTCPTKSKQTVPALKFLILSLLLTCSMVSFAQTTYNFTSGSTLSNQGGYYNTQATITVDAVSYKLTHLGNGNFTNQATGGNGNSACLKKDGSGGDFLKIERTDGQPFQFYGMWLYTSSMYSPPYYQPPYYNIKYYDQNNAEIIADTYSSNALTETITVSKNLKVNYVYVTLNAIMVFKLDDLVVGPAAASAPTVTSNSINQFTNNSALLGGNVTADGGATVTERGVVYGTSTAPTIANTKVAIGSGTGTFSQTATGLNAGTTYYVRAYATNSAGTGYGSEYSFTTAPAFSLAQVHYFNTAWVSTTSQASPFTKFVEGWNITGTSTGSGLISVSRITGISGTTAAGEGVASLRVQSSTTLEDLVSVSVKTYDNSPFDLQSFKFKYLTKVINTTSFGTITVTGYSNGIAVPGASASVNGVAQATAASYAYATFDLSSNSNFNNIDQFIINASNPVNAARLSAIDLDVLNIAAPTTLPLSLSAFTGNIKEKTSVLNWTTAQEQQTKNFEIEYSKDGIAFTGIGKVSAAGNSNAERLYTFIHNNPATENNFYRLKMNDMDGKFTHSNVINLRLTSTNKDMYVYPNPVTGNYFYVNTGSGTTLPLSYKIVTMEGRNVQTGTISEHNQKLSINQLDKGNYFIILSDGQSQKITL